MAALGFLRRRLLAGELALEPDSFLALAIKSSCPAGSVAMKLVHQSLWLGFAPQLHNVAA